MPPSITSPLALAPCYRSRVWGDGAIARHFGRSTPAPHTDIGESWELCDFPPHMLEPNLGNSTIMHGPLAGQTLAQVRFSHAKALMGDLAVNPSTGGFPLLIKYLDAAAHVSIQVHPSPEYAATHPETHIKHEAWLIVDCQPGASIYKGLKPGVTAADMQAALSRKTPATVCSLLENIPVSPGDCHYIPSGCCHALGPGILAAEIQTPSDTTFRVYDWGRAGRELHIEQALACIDFSNKPLPPSTRAKKTPGKTRMAECDFFACDHHHLAPHQSMEAPQDGRPVAWMVLSGSVTTPDSRSFHAGQTLLWPASCAHRHAKASTSGAAVLETTFPR